MRYNKNVINGSLLFDQSPLILSVKFISLVHGDILIDEGIDLLVHILAQFSTDNSPVANYHKQDEENTEYYCDSYPDQL